MLKKIFTLLRSDRFEISRLVPNALSALASLRLQYLALSAALFISSACLYSSMLAQTSTIDEGNHYVWAEQFLETGNAHRDQQFSTTPITTINVIFTKYLKNLAINLRSYLPQYYSFHFKLWLDTHELAVRRFATSWWYFVCVAGAFALAAHIRGTRAAVLAAFFTALTPSLIANSSVSTVDAAFAAAAIWCVLASIRLAERGTTFDVMVTGMAFAFAACTKFSALILAPGILVAGLIAFSRRRGAFHEQWHVVPLGALFLAVAVITIDLCYDFVAIRVFFQSYFFRYPLLLKFQSLFGFLPVGLPVGFLEGLDGCFNVENNRFWNVVILDRWYSHGVWFYFPLLFFFKTPTALIAFQLLALITVRRFRWRTSSSILLIHIAVSATYFCLFFRTQVGIRYVLFILPLLSVVSACALATHLKPRLISLLMGICLVGCTRDFRPVSNSMLSYVNFDFVDKERPYLYVADSNFDWSQNWGLLAYEVKPVDYRTVDIVQPGRNMIFANLLSGVYWNFNQFLWLRRNIAPAETRAHTFFVFNITPGDYQRFIEEERNYTSHQRSVNECRSLPSLPRGSLELQDSEVRRFCVHSKARTLVSFATRTAKPLRVGYYTPWGDCDSVLANQKERVPFLLQDGDHVLCVQGIGTIDVDVRSDYPGGLAEYYR